MKVLVIDDDVANQQSAHALLSEHDLTVVGTSWEAAEMIGKNEYDVVLTDLFMSATPDPKEKVNRRVFGSFGAATSDSGDSAEHPLGFGFALWALTRGVKYVAVVTDTDHHSNAISAQIDWFHDSYGDSEPNRLEFSGGRLAILHACASDEDMIRREVLGKRGITGKDWELALERLLR